MRDSTLGWLSVGFLVTIGCGGSEGSSQTGGTGGATIAGSPSSSAQGGGSSNTGSTASSGSGTGGQAMKGPDPCIGAGTCPPGEWIGVTPPDIDLGATLSCGNFGSETIQVDPVHAETVYTSFNCRGIWVSHDYGMTWAGPVNTGANADAVTKCAGGLTTPPNGATGTVFLSCIRDGADTIGFWKSTNGGVDWTRYNVAPGGDRQDFYPPAVDPHDPNHLLMVGHEMNVFAESVDGGETWTPVTLDPGMVQPGGTASLSFIDTGEKTTTRKTWLDVGQGVGTWRTEDAGAHWTKIDKNEKAHSLYQIYQPDTSGVVFMSGVYSDAGWGVLRSTDYGKTWAHVGATASENIVFGTPNHVYSMYGWAIGAGQTVDPTLQIADSTGMTWMTSPTPAAMTQGPAQATVADDGTYHIILTANFNGGIWRYVEPL